MPTKMQMNHRQVVSNFILKQEGDDISVALFRRSDKVRTYPLKLAPISGTVEKGERPYDAAVREIEEETGLVAGQDLELHLSGKPFSLSDETIGRSWTIYPFSWKLAESTPMINLDWEHVDFQWTKPEDVLSDSFEHDSVPNLDKSLERVLLTNGALFEVWQVKDTLTFEMLSNTLSALRDDHSSGAGWMATLAVEHYRGVVLALAPHQDRKRYWYQLRMIAWHIIHNGRPSMNAAIERALLAVLRRIEPLREKQQILAEIQKCLDERSTTSRRLPTSFVSYISHHFEARRNKAKPGERTVISILTLSASIIKAAILAVIKNLPDVEIDLRILESRPLCEGAQMASKLLHSVRKSEEDRLRITIATDASAAILARDVDLVLLGADRISEQGDVSNKTGSFAAALCARAVGRKSPDAITPKVVIISGTEKIVKPGGLDEHAEEDNSSAQVWRVWDVAGCKQEVQLRHNKRVTFKNVFFEWVPAEYIDLYLTEHGAMSTSQIQEESHARQRLEDEMFDL